MVSRSRVSRSSGCTRTTSDDSTSAVGISPCSRNARCTACTCGPDRRADRDVIEHFAAHPVGDLRRAFDKAPDLQVDAPAQLLDAEAGVDAPLNDAFEQRADRPPERSLRRMRLHVLDALDRVAHDARAVIVAAQPREQTALVEPALLDQERRQLLRGYRLARSQCLRRARRQVRVEQVGRRGGLDAARLLHQLVFGKQLERYRTRAADELVEKDAQLAAGAVDEIAAVLDLARRQLPPGAPAGARSRRYRPLPRRARPSGSRRRPGARACARA